MSYEITIAALVVFTSQPQLPQPFPMAPKPKWRTKRQPKEDQRCFVTTPEAAVIETLFDGLNHCTFTTDSEGIINLGPAVIVTAWQPAASLDVEPPDAEDPRWKRAPKSPREFASVWALTDLGDTYAATYDGLAFWDVDDEAAGIFAVAWMARKPAPTMPEPYQPDPEPVAQAE